MTPQEAADALAEYALKDTPEQVLDKLRAKNCVNGHAERLLHNATIALCAGALSATAAVDDNDAYEMSQALGHLADAELSLTAATEFVPSLSGIEPIIERVRGFRDALSRQQNPSHPYLSLSTIKKYEPMMSKKGVSEVARSPRGFLTAYKKAGGKSSGLSDQWKAKRDGFIARHMAQVRSNNEPLMKNGKPTRRHLALIAWAYSPQASKL